MHKGEYFSTYVQTLVPSLLKDLHEVGEIKCVRRCCFVRSTNTRREKSLFSSLVLSDSHKCPLSLGHVDIVPIHSFSSF